MTAVAGARLAPLPWREGLTSSALLFTPVVWWLVSLDGLSLGWDTLNHHFYLGWIAATGRPLTHDVFAAGSMSCQYPFAYVPLYWLEHAGATGQQAALVLALPALAAIPAVWLIGWTLFPAVGMAAAAARLVWTALGFMSPLWWSLLDSTSNDLSSSTPMIWAFAFALWRAQREATEARSTTATAIVWWGAVGALATIALVMKISHAFGALGLASVILLTASNLPNIGRRALGACLGSAVVLLMIWWPWARATWEACGSPIYPMMVEQLGPWRYRLP